MHAPSLFRCFYCKRHVGKIKLSQKYVQQPHAFIGVFYKVGEISQKAIYKIYQS